MYAEELLCLDLARRLRVPVRWTEGRSENALATIQGRGQIQDIELAADADGRITAVRVDLLCDMGAYLQLVTPGIPLLGAFLYHGVYDVGGVLVPLHVVFTNKTPTDAYRGAGRPEATYAIERAIDSLAEAVGVDQAEIRRRNFIRLPFADDWNVAAGLVFDSGDYVGSLDDGPAPRGLRRREGRPAGAARSGRQVQVGRRPLVLRRDVRPGAVRVLASLNYSAGGWEAATVRVLPTGKVQVVTGTAPHGQGHETAWSMLVAERLGVSPDDIEVLHSDTAIAPLGMDSYGSRSLSVGGAAIWAATDKVIAKARAIAAHQLEANEDDLEFEGGHLPGQGHARQGGGAGGDRLRRLHRPRPARRHGAQPRGVGDLGPGELHLPVGHPRRRGRGRHRDRPRRRSCEYIAVDDCGNQVNPLIVEGQIHGGIAQGVAQALYEEAVYDAEGNLRNVHPGRLPGAVGRRDALVRAGLAR